LRRATRSRKVAVDLCVNVLVRRVRHACFAAPRRSGVREGPQGRRAGSK